MRFDDATDSFMHLLPGCSVLEAVDALRYAVIEFCRETQVLTSWVTKQSDSMTFDTTGDEATQVIALHDAFVNGVQATITGLNTHVAADATATDPQVSVGNKLNLSASMSVLPTFSPAVPVKLLVTLVPTPDAVEFDDALWLTHREALKSGALARLFAEPALPYTSDSRAAFHEGKFKQAMSDAGFKTGTTFTNTTPLRVQPA